MNVQSVRWRDARDLAVNELVLCDFGTGPELALVLVVEAGEDNALVTFGTLQAREQKTFRECQIFCV